MLGVLGVLGVWSQLLCCAGGRGVGGGGAQCCECGGFGCGASRRRFVVMMGGEAVSGGGGAFVHLSGTSACLWLQHESTFGVLPCVGWVETAWRLCGFLVQNGAGNGA